MIKVYSMTSIMDLSFPGQWTAKATSCIPHDTGLQITAGQRTMSGLIVDLTGQTPVLPLIFGYKHFLFNRVVA